MSGLADQLYNLYTAEIYTALTNNDPEYKRSLFSAGLGWNVCAVPPEKRRAFEQVMKIQAWMCACKVQEAKSLVPATIRAKLLDGPTTLYRVRERNSKRETGHWWFTEKVAQRCRAEAGKDGKKQLDWLRNVLAVCFNFSYFDQLERFPLNQGERIPAVIGKGLPMPYYKLMPFFDKETGEQVIPWPKDAKFYWEAKGKELIGDELQVVLPWIPVERVRTTEHL